MSLRFPANGRSHATASFARVLAFLAAPSAFGCEAQPKIRTVRVSTHTLVSCPLTPSDVESAELWLSPEGDFSSDDSLREPLALSVPSELGLPSGLSALSAVVKTPGGNFHGYSERTQLTELPLLLWPEARACRLDSEAFAYPRSGEGHAIGFSPETRTLLLAGGSSASDPAASVAALTFDAGTGGSTLLEGSKSGAALTQSRAFATVTPFGARLIVAGGEDPLVAPDGDLRAPRQTAEVFDPLRGRFADDVIDLAVPRAQHSAIRLRNGDTLLVGGRGLRGNVTNVLETISEGASTSSIAGLRALKFPRLFPVVLALDDDRLFVGGGMAADGTPVSAFEWLSSDARTYLDDWLPSALPPRHDRALVALPGGGVLLVGGCQPSVTSACRGPCREGCPPAGALPESPARYDAWWLAPDKTLTELELDIDAPRPILVAAADGMPILAGGVPGDNGLFRFNPWNVRFERMEQPIAPPPRAGFPVTLLDAGAVAWVAEGESGMALYGMRFGTRSRYASDLAFVSGATVEGARAPFPLVPDRPTGSSVRFDAGSALLVFEANSSAKVFVAGTDYAGLSVDLWVEGEAPRIVLGTREYGGPECPWPEGARTRFRLERSGENVHLSSGSLTTPICQGPLGRVRLGLYRGNGATVLRHASVVRGP